MNTHLDEPGDTDANTSLIDTELEYVGVTKVRDSMASPNDAALFAAVADAAGVKFDVYLSVSSFSYAGQIAEMQSVPSILVSVEGLNEGDKNLSAVSYDNLTGYAAIAAMQQALYTATTANPATANLPVIAPSYGNVADFPLAPNTSSYSTDGNTHEYFPTGNPPAASIPQYITDAQMVSGNQPIIATEAGYYTGSSLQGTNPTYQQSGVDQLVQAKYDLTLLFDDWRAGIQSTYLYDLMDDASDPNNTNYNDHYGLFNADGTPKTAAIAIHNLTAVLADNGTPRNDTLGYQITGMPITGNSLLLEKSTGVFDLAVWNDVRLWNSTSPTETTNAAVPITVSFGQYVQSVSEYDPLLGTTAVLTWKQVSSISLDLPDHPVILEVTPYTPSAFSLASFVLPETVAASEATANLWGTLIANATDADPNPLSNVVVSSVGTIGTSGTLTFNAALQTLTYTAPVYDPFTPTDSFTYTLTDADGDTVTGTVAITETPPPNTTYGTVAGTRLDAPSGGWTMISMATGEQLYGATQGGDAFVGNVDTRIYASGTNNTITGGNGNFVAGGGGNGARITLGNGNNTIGLTGSGNSVTTGNGNNVLWKSLGSTSITMGNGNESITAGGTNNTISIGTGVSTLNIGNDGNAAGHENVSVAGGTNVINLGGANDTVVVGGGTGNLIVSTGGLATIQVDAGSSTVVGQGNNNQITALAGTNNIQTSGNGDTITGGVGSDTIWAGGNSNDIIATAGTETITLIGTGNTVAGGTGALTVTDDSSGNTYVLAGAGAPEAKLYVDLSKQKDILDLRQVLAATSWDDKSSDIGNYLQVANVGSSSIISVNPDGTGPAPAVAVADLENSSGLTLQALLASAILPAPAGVIALTSSIVTETLSAQQSSGNLWSTLVGNATESNPSWLSGVVVSAVGTTGTIGMVTFNAASQTLVYQGPAYNPFSPTDSFTYTLTDAYGDAITGTVDLTETAPAKTTYDLVAGTRVNAPASGWKLISEMPGQQFYGSSQGGDTFIGDTNTAIYAAGTNNTIIDGDGNFIAGGGGNGARITLGNGNNTIGLTGSGNFVSTGNGNNTVWKSLGSTSITMGNGNESITAGGSNNTISIGTGVSTLNIGNDGQAAGYENVTVAGGTNVINLGGADDTVAVAGGTGNQILSSGGLATILLDAGSNTVTSQGNNNRITALAGANNIQTSGNGDTITGGTGSDTIWAGGNGNRITATSGADSITFVGTGSTVAGGSGALTVTDNGSQNTYALSATASQAEQIFGNVIGEADVFDLRTALATTKWDGNGTDLGNYLSVQDVGSTSVISITPSGLSGTTAAIADLHNVSNLTLQGLLSHAIT